MGKKKYVVVQLCNDMTSSQAEQFSKVLNSGYFILAEYRFKDTATIVLKLEESEVLNDDIDA